MNENLNNDILDFINQSPTAYHAVDNLKKLLVKNNFTELKVNEPWNLNPKGKYFVVFFDSSIIAFKNGTEYYHLIGSHSDSPGFKLKNNPLLKNKGFYSLNTEVYGGPLLYTWFDRPLSLAGRVVFREANKLKTKLINIDRDLLTIPSLAIHMGLKQNEGYAINPQKDTLPIIGLNLEHKDPILTLCANELNISREDLLETELFLYPREKGSFVGLNSEFYSAPRIDNLVSSYLSIRALINSTESHHLQIAFIADHEEVGSMSKTGAFSSNLKDSLLRIELANGGTFESFLKKQSQSFMISADQAHSFHPNYPEKNDLSNYPIINGGIVLKYSGSMAYTTDALTASYIKDLCINHGIPYQVFHNRSDIRGGSTIGPIASVHLNIPSVDIGIPILAMHSVRELGGTKDNISMYDLFLTFYNIE